MKRCALSMLEMCEVEEMRDFGEVLEVIGHDENGAAGGYGETSGDNVLGDEGDFLLIDTSEHSEEAKEFEDKSVGGYLQMPMNGMSRSTSMHSFSTASKQQDLCLSSIMALPNIVEETTCATTVSSHSPKNDDVDSSNESQPYTDPPSSGHDEQLTVKSNAKTTTQPNDPNDLDQSTTSLISTNSAPLRSSLKRKDSVGDLDQSGSSNLRSSIKSIDSNNDNQSLKRNVSFTSLEIRSYNVTLGDAPTSHGPPVSLDWDYHPEPEVIEIDSYEHHREHERRSRNEMLMPASHRKYLLMREAGFTRSEIQRAVEDARLIVKGRERTRKNLRLMPVEEAWEGTKRKFGKLVRRNSRDKI